MGISRRIWWKVKMRAEGEAEVEAEGEADDEGPSKKALPPSTKKVKHDRDRPLRTNSLSPRAFFPFPPKTDANPT
jgi:hypothetical protein